MALTIDRILDPDSRVEGTWRIGVAKITLDNSYPTGGEAVTPGDFGLDQVDFVIPVVESLGGTVNVATVTYDRANKKLQVWDETPAEVANASDLSTLIVLCIAFGR